ncbi:hypothetical protein Acr_12g0001880 [Actinidia rufa]|uniref:Retrotransposon gag domain-containing protein n=1 Tax=Actinidia rufa TaxID=165716 RepID=A0A7J0FIB6_9ERIC|nr:hypothetical protein Acr_12g0001880 [Actinidia rufa]
MVNTRANGQGDRENKNTNTQMNELRDMVQALVGAMAAQQQLFQQYMQPPQPPQGRDQYSGGGENRQQGETSEYREETEDPPSYISGECYRGEANRWWNLKGVREPMMNWARFKVIFREKFVPRAVQNAKSAEFERLKQMGTTIAEYEASFTNLAEYAPHLVATDEMRARRFEDGLRHEIKRVIRPLVLPTYAQVLDRAIIVEQDETERKNYFDSKRKKNFNNEGMSGQKKQKPDVNSKNQGNNPSGQVPMCSKCGKYHWGECWRDRAEVPGGGNARPVSNRPVNQGNRGGGGNEQRQGQVFTLMPGDARNNEDVVAVIPTDLIPLEMGYF